MGAKLTVKPCPVCGKQPDVDRCHPGPGWYANCYGLRPYEHNIGGNGETRDEAIAEYNAEVALSPASKDNDHA